ncbi:polysaccharide biosynthesis tyrosine autokinase [Cellulomonas sp. ATA003]|uniref:polysaccharide biosynthesis tyrosine autokinase n=1 Tax=Cellulomonas sp. ATA003 TaxID=3073064 RepID=UPI002873387C|nr:polysaccharide biosynthesis tyrosine autokinase [Cellulomonas sp. ATA003]WNB85213.1 polysaccharide biosynthesis tyrosine autokinase [Cellulomonas sp. ATA003]
MELHDYLVTLRKRWVSVALITALALCAAVAATLIATPTYEAKSQVFVSVRTAGGSTSDLVQGSSFTQKQVKSYTDLVTSPRVLIPVIEHLDLATTPDELARSVSSSTPMDTVLINITASDADPQVASDVANAVADSLATQVTELEQPSDAEVSPVEINTVRTATPPTAPSSPDTLLNLALGLLVGLAAGVGLAVLREVLDTKVRTEVDVNRVTDTSVIATIGYDVNAPDEPLIVQTSPQSHRAESFRRLRTNLQFLDIADRPQTIVVTSSLPGEGKSTTTVNLAISLADAGSRVILVDADLRRPSVAEYMGLEGEVGLTTVLIGRATVEDVVQPWGNGNLHILASGQIPPNPSELLGSRSMAKLLDELAAEYDVVLIDTPPLLPVTDAAILSKLTGGALVVVGSEKLHRAQLAEAMGSLETVGARVLGVVLNRLARTQGDTYAYYDYSSTPAEPSSRRQKRSGAASLPQQRPGRTSDRRFPSRAQGDVAAEMIESTNGVLAGASSTRWPGEPLSRRDADPR